MTKTEQRRIGGQIRQLRADRRNWLNGTNSPWGFPVCGGSPYCEGPACIGCAGTAWISYRAQEITGQIQHLEARLEPVTQGALF